MTTENQLKRAFNLQYELEDYIKLVYEDVSKYIEHFNRDFVGIDDIIFSEKGDLEVRYQALELDRFEEHEQYNGYSISVPLDYLLCENKENYLNNLKK